MARKGPVMSGYAGTTSKTLRMLEKDLGLKFTQLTARPPARDFGAHYRRRNPQHILEVSWYDGFQHLEHGNFVMSVISDDPTTNDSVRKGFERKTGISLRLMDNPHGLGEDYVARKWRSTVRSKKIVQDF